MGTDKHENDIRRKGRPAGRGKGGTNLKDAFASTNPEQEQQLEERYLQDDRTPASNVRQQHPNRNLDKGDEE